MNPEVRYAFVSAVLTAATDQKLDGLALTREFVDEYVQLFLEAKDFSITSTEVAHFLHIPWVETVRRKIRKFYRSGQDYILTEAIQAPSPRMGRPAVEYYLSRKCAKSISMTMDVPRSKLVQLYYMQVDNMYRAFMEDKISWRRRTDSPETWKARREVQKPLLPHTGGVYEINYTKMDPVTQIVKTVKKFGSADDLASRNGTLPFEYEGTPKVIRVASVPEERKFVEECFHLEAKERRVRGELYDMADSEGKDVWKECMELNEIRKARRKLHSPLPGLERVPHVSPTAKDFFRLHTDKDGKVHRPKLTRGSRPIPKGVPAWVYEL
jgi:hypothetical protein